MISLFHYLLQTVVEEKLSTKSRLDFSHKTVVEHTLKKVKSCHFIIKCQMNSKEKTLNAFSIIFGVFHK